MPEEAITFRRYQQSEEESVWAAFAACTHQLGFALGPWDDDVPTIQQTYLDPGGEFIVGEVDERIVAFGGWQPEAGNRARVRRVGVHPDVQRRGFGRRLIAELEDRARRRGIRALYLDTSVGQIAARKLYQSCGYRETGHIVLGGVECILFEKELDGVE